jgi:hypothetical protein
MTVATLPIDIILRAFFDTKLGRAKPERRQRLCEVDERLRRYLEHEVPGRLCAECNALILAERQFDPVDVVARLFGAGVLLGSLPGFLTFGYLATDAAVRRTQYEVVRGLGRMLRDDELVFDGDYAEFEAALSRVVQRPPRRGRPW